MGRLNSMYAYSKTHANLLSWLYSKLLKIFLFYINTHSWTCKYNGFYFPLIIKEIC